ncbi:MAG: GGDEF domain-containing protein [Alcanivoracaceae bacterium]|nr:GGDEF domain-containing protein [Alcanivoracaceae bacterium]
MDWSFVARGSLPLIILIVLWLSHGTWAFLSLFYFNGKKVFSLEQLWVQAPVILFIILGAFSILALGLLLKRRNLEPVWFQHLTANYYGLSLVWGGSLVGSLNLASGAVLMGAPLIGFLILERRVVFFAFIVAFTALLLLNVASALNLIPYAPFIRSPNEGGDTLLWTHSQLLMAAPHIVINVALAALVLGQWRLREANVRTLGLTDQLTLLPNRRAILMQLRRELSRAHRQKRPLCVVLLDLDHFKSINDKWGHPSGDEVLRRTSEIIRNEIRAGDYIGRFGGEEFLLLLPQAAPEEAREIIERIRLKLNHEPIAVGATTPIHVSASFGISWACGSKPCDITTILAAADLALYRAKERGRNRLELAEKSCSSPKENQKTYPRVSVENHFNLGKVTNARWWREFLIGILDWTPVNKARLIAGILLLISVNFIATLEFISSIHSGKIRVDIQTARLLTDLSIGLSLLCFFSIWAGRYINIRWPGSRWYQIFVLQMFGQSLVFYGYMLGIMYMHTGIMLLCSPIVGFILFERRIVLQVFFTSVIGVLACSYASAYGLLPYAPLISVGAPAWQINTPFWTLLTYFICTYILIVTFILIDHVLGRWREREAEIRVISITDALTNVRNRHSILHQLDVLLETAIRHEQPLSIAVLDLDKFKYINDTWGHPTGDEVLRVTAKALTKCLRDGDEMGRFGGEEFLILLPNTDLVGATALAERCRRSLEAIELFAPNKAAVSISASFGIASMENASASASFNGDPEQLIKAADEALYTAKENGRNRVEAVLVHD